MPQEGVSYSRIASFLYLRAEDINARFQLRSAEISYNTLCKVLLQHINQVISILGERKHLLRFLCKCISKIIPMTTNLRNSVLQLRHKVLAGREAEL